MLVAVVGVTVRLLPTFDWLKVPVYGPVDDTETASPPSTPDRVWVLAVIVAAVVPSYTLFCAVTPAAMVNGAGVMFAAIGVVKPVT